VEAEMKRQAPAAKKSVFVAVWIAMLIACVFYFYLIEIFSIPEGTNPPHMFPVVYAIILSAAFSALLGVYFIWRRTDKYMDKGATAYIENALVMFIIGLVIFEAIAISGLVIRFMGFSYIHKGFVIMSAFMILLAGTRVGPIFSRYNYLRKKERAGGR
jgi:uncharacterized membrane protein YidH (DUF202 family)